MRTGNDYWTCNTIWSRSAAGTSPRTTDAVAKKKRDRVYAAGALVWRTHKRSLQVLLIHRPRYDDWSWPKGKVDPGESMPACAVREVAEETGIQVELGLPLPTVKYRVNSSKTKVCRYWAARPIDESRGAVAARRLTSPTAGEVDEVRWVDARKALKKLTYKHDRDPLGALIDLHDDGFLDTWSVLIARHGRAKKRSAWPDGEATRPDRKSTRLNSSHVAISYAVFCLNKKKKV